MNHPVYMVTVSCGRYGHVNSVFYVGRSTFLIRTRYNKRYHILFFNVFKHVKQAQQVRNIVDFHKDKLAVIKFMMSSILRSTYINYKIIYKLH